MALRVERGGGCSDDKVSGQLAAGGMEKSLWAGDRAGGAMPGADARSWVTVLVWSKGRGNVCSAEGSRAGVLWAGCWGDSWAGDIWVQRKVCLARVPGQEAVEGVSVRWWG